MCTAIMIRPQSLPTLHSPLAADLRRPPSSSALLAANAILDGSPSSATGRASSPAELRRPSSSSFLRPASPAEIRRPRGLATAGQSMLNLKPSTRLESQESDGDDDDTGLGETLWRKQQRDKIKKGSLRAARPESLPNTSDVGLGHSSPSKASQELPPLRVRPALNRPAEQGTDVKQADHNAKDDKEVVTKQKRNRSDAQAQASACWEDLISFLELNKLPGAYALAFSAYGVEDLSSLLLLDDAGLSSLLARCNIDAMDEILLLEALRSTKAFQ